MTTQQKLIRTACAMAVVGACANAQASTLDDTEFSYGGYVKLDAMWTDTSSGQINGDSIGRDFYVPSTVPVGPDVDTDPVFDMHARESRFNLNTATMLDNGKEVKTKIELDFIGSVGGNERVSNSYSPRLRQAFITYDGFLFGQAWSNFQNVAALPEALDFVGPAEGTVFVRQAQARYTTGNWSFSLENPESSITVNGARVETDDASLPDLTARYNFNADWGQIVVTALARQLTYKQAGADADTSSFGLSVSGKFNVGQKDNIKFMLTSGSGLGRYVGLNVAHGAVYDGEDIDAIDSTSGFVAYQHHWNEKFRSTFLYSFFEADNNDDLLLYSINPTESSVSYSANLLYSPVKRMTFGVEYKIAERDTELGFDGDLDRLQFSARYAF